MFGTLVIAYLFLGGTAAGMFFVTGAWSLAFHLGGNRPSPRMRRSFKAFLSRSYTVALTLLAISVLCLVGDLEYPERALLILTHPHLTPVTIGAFALAVQGALGLALAASNSLGVRWVGGRARGLLEALSCLCALTVMAYTGVFLASNESVPFWNNWALTPLFVFSALSCGVSAVLLVNYFVQGQTLLLRAAKPLQRAHLSFLALEAVALTAFLSFGFATPRAAKSLALLFGPDVLPTAAVGALGMGIAVPFLLESYALLRKECRTIPVSDVVCLLGGFCLRWCIITCGLH